MYDHEENLIAVLKEYWENQIHYLACTLDCLNISESIKEKKFQNSAYVGKLALKIASDVCESSDEEWAKILEKHWFGTENSTAAYLSTIIVHLQNIRINNSQDPKLKQAVLLVTDDDYKDLIRKRRKQVTDNINLRSKLRV